MPPLATFGGGARPLLSFSNFFLKNNFLSFIYIFNNFLFFLFKVTRVILLVLTWYLIEYVKIFNEI
jgi:hypothetical protein